MRSVNRLSPREFEVARLAASGFTCKDIAERLFLSTNTVKTHLEHVYGKLGVKNRAQLSQRFITSPPGIPDPSHYVS